MILIYSETTSYRLQYICQFIFKEQLRSTYSLTLDKTSFDHHTGPKINYSGQQFLNPGFTINASSLLFESDIKEQNITCFDTNNYRAFFKLKDSDLPFDIFAASFYLLTRYEEYLPHTKDKYGRYAHENSLAYRQGFLNQPVINIWIRSFADCLCNRFPSLKFNVYQFKYTPTYDIDIAYSYKSKGFLRNLGGFIKSPSADRIKVLLGVQNDPYDSYGFLDTLHDQYKLNPYYFFLAATSATEYDKNLSPYSSSMWQLIKRHANKYSVGIHPSWKSFENPALISKEKKIIETAADRTITDSRQHYIKLTLPRTLEVLSKAGIENDYSMGYGSINGFRASTGASFFWYNLATEKITSLRLHPFCFMDANSFYEQKQDARSAFEELNHFLNISIKYGCELTTIFHNQFLGTDKKFAGWREGYESFMSRIPL